MDQITSPHDKFFKQVFTRGDTAKEFLLNYLPPAVVKLIDWDSLEYTKDSFIDEDLKEFFLISFSGRSLRTAHEDMCIFSLSTRVIMNR